MSVGVGVGMEKCIYLHIYVHEMYMYMYMHTCVPVKRLGGLPHVVFKCSSSKPTCT